MRGFFGPVHTKQTSDKQKSHGAWEGLRELPTQSKVGAVGKSGWRAEGTYLSHLGGRDPEGADYLGSHAGSAL